MLTVCLQEGKLDDMKQMIGILSDLGRTDNKYFKQQVGRGDQRRGCLLAALALWCCQVGWNVSKLKSRNFRNMTVCCKATLSMALPCSGTPSVLRQTKCHMQSCKTKWACAMCIHGMLPCHCCAATLTNAF